MLDDAAGLLLLTRAAAAVPGGVGLYDVEGERLIPLGGGIAALLGRAPAPGQSIDGSELRALVHGDDHPRLDALIRRVGALNEGDATDEALRLRHADGDWRSFRLSAAVLTRGAKRRATVVLGVITPSADAASAVAGAAGEDAAALLATLLEHAPESLTVSGGPPDFPLTAASRRARELFGRKLDGLADLGTTAPRRTYGLYRADGRALAKLDEMPPARAACADETIVGEEWLIRRPDRSVVPVEVHAAPIRRDGVTVGAVCSWRDASEHRQLERALQERAEQLALLLRSTRGGWWSYEPAIGELSWSDECAQLLAWPPAQRPSREAFLEMVNAADRKAVAAALELALYECVPLDLEFRVHPVHGDERWLSAAADCHSDDEGHPLRLFGVMTDITAKKRADAALRESEERFRKLAETIPEVFWVVDPVGRKLLYVSPAYERIFGHDGEHADLESWLRAVHPADRERVARTLAGEVAGAEFSQEYRVRTALGTRWLRDRGLVSRDAGGRPTRVLGLTEETTEHRRDTARRERATENATVDAAGLVQAAAAGLKPFAARRRQTLALHLAPAPMPLAGDRAALLRTVAQLIEVSARCTPAGERVEVRVRPRNGVAVVQVSGNHAGLTRETVNRLLDLQVCAEYASDDGDSARLAAIFGAVREQAEGHGGSLSAEPGGADGHGGFVLRLPLAAAPSAGRRKDTPPEARTSGGDQRDGSPAEK